MSNASSVSTRLWQRGCGNGCLISLALGMQFFELINGNAETLCVLQKVATLNYLVAQTARLWHFCLPIDLLTQRGGESF